MESFGHNWTCPHCGRPQTATERDFDSGEIHFLMTESALGPIGIQATAACCANPECKLPMVHVTIGTTAYNSARHERYFVEGGELFGRRLIPESHAKPQPEYIPEALRDDYVEACRIRDLSPKASATLARRCLQGMIRDFCGISKGRLIDEINELKKRIEDDNAPKNVSDDSVEAIDAVRKIGNIGAHMEKDINKIIDVDPDEAQLLIELIETLFDEWYVQREKRKARFAKVRAIAAEIDDQKKLAQAKPDLIEGPKEE